MSSLPLSLHCVLQEKPHRRSQTDDIAAPVTEFGTQKRHDSAALLINVAVRTSHTPNIHALLPGQFVTNAVLVSGILALQAHHCSAPNPLTCRKLMGMGATGIRIPASNKTLSTIIIYEV